MVDYQADMYITGSNAHVLSSDLATYITGRYVTISVYPLSFSEFLPVYKEEYSQTNTREAYLLYEVPREDTVGKKILREFGALELLGDNYPKYVLSLDEFPRSRNGIQGLNLIDWLQ